jgi:hypothetical protein
MPSGMRPSSFPRTVRASSWCGPRQRTLRRTLVTKLEKPPTLAPTSIHACSRSYSLRGKPALSTCSRGDCPEPRSGGSTCMTLARRRVGVGRISFGVATSAVRVCVCAGSHDLALGLEVAGRSWQVARQGVASPVWHGDGAADSCAAGQPARCALELRRPRAGTGRAGQGAGGHAVVDAHGRGRLRQNAVGVARCVRARRAFPRRGLVGRVGRAR